MKLEFLNKINKYHGKAQRLRTLPNAELVNSDAVFSIYQNGRKLGTITISKGSIEWFPRNFKHPYSSSWAQFDKMIKKSAET